MPPAGLRLRSPAPYPGPMLRFLLALVRTRLWKDNRGQDVVEYALMAGFITVAIAATFPPVSGGINAVFSRLTSLLSRSV